MKDYQPDKIKTIALLGHQGSGKTSLIESLLFVNKLITKKGTTEDGNTHSDFTKEEKSMKVSVYSTVFPIEYQDHKFNFIDTPGFLDFVGEVNSALKAAQSAILIVDASKGVEVGTRLMWKSIRAKSKPSIIFINKMDKLSAPFEELIDQIRSKFGKKVVPLCWPIGKSENFDGYVDVLENRAKIFNGTNVEDGDVHPDKQEHINQLREMIVESVAEVNDDICEKFLVGEEVGNEELQEALTQAVREGLLVPILVGSASKNVGITTLLDKVQEYLPSATDEIAKFADGDENEYEERVHDVSVDAPFSGFVFKTVVDPFLGRISYIIVRSGTLTNGQTIYISNKEVKEKVGNVSYLFGKDHIEATKVVAGDIGVIVKSNNLETGDTLCDEAHKVVYAPINNPQPTLDVSIVVKTKNDEGKIGEALRKIAMEDLTVTVNRNQVTKQLLVGGLGQLHIDVVKDKLKNIYNIDVIQEPAKIAYKETIKGKSDVIGRYVKQSGGGGQYGIVNIRFEPSEQEFEFVNDIFGGAVPSNFIPAVEKGLIESMKTGVLTGNPVIGIKATLYDGKHHAVDSSELAFKMAASLAFKEGCKQANPTLLEPIMEVRVTVPQEYVGDVMGDLSKRRGLVMGMEPADDESVIVAQVPQSEILSYIVDLKTMTQAQATFTSTFVRYDEVPAHIAEKVIQELNAEAVESK